MLTHVSNMGSQCYIQGPLFSLWVSQVSAHGPLTRYVTLRVAHAPGMPGTFPRHRLQMKPLISDPGMHHGTCVTHVPWCMSGSQIRGGGENVPGIPGACATLNFMYLARGPMLVKWGPNVISRARYFLCGWANSQPMSKDVTYVAPSLIG